MTSLTNMKKNKKLILIMLMAFLAVTLLPAHCVRATNVKKPTEKIILIDAGHGGFDGGAVSKLGTVEKDINLKISHDLRAELEKRGYKVVMTREKDEALIPEGDVPNAKVVDLGNRAKKIKESNCDMFISIHLNKFPEEKYYGAQVWYGGNDKSKLLANVIQCTFKQELDGSNNRMEKPAKNDYKILRGKYDIPAVIVECGFLSNYQEEQKLKTEEYQRKVANSIANSIDRYFELQQNSVTNLQKDANR